MVIHLYQDMQYQAGYSLRLKVRRIIFQYLYGAFKTIIRDRFIIVNRTELGCRTTEWRNRKSENDREDIFQ